MGSWRKSPPGVEPMPWSRRADLGPQHGAFLRTGCSNSRFMQVQPGVTPNPLAFAELSASPSPGGPQKLEPPLQSTGGELPTPCCLQSQVWDTHHEVTTHPAGLLLGQCPGLRILSDTALTLAGRRRSLCLHPQPGTCSLRPQRSPSREAPAHSLARWRREEVWGLGFQSPGPNRRRLEAGLWWGACALASGPAERRGRLAQG